MCVTGGAGFIGSHLVDALVGRGASVVVLDDLSSGLRENLNAHAGAITIIEGSILDDAALAHAITSGTEFVFHEAAVTSVPRSVAEPMLYHEVNCLGTMRVLEASRRAGVKRVVFASSSSAYGEQPGDVKVESMPMLPRSPYAAAKCAGEHMMRAWAHCFGLSTISLRYFNIFGQRQLADSPYAAVIPKFVDALMRGSSPIIFGDGTQTRDFTHVSNAVHANLLAGACDRDLRGEVVNIAAGEGASVMSLLQSVAEILGVNPRYELAPSRPGEVMHSKASIDAARALIGYAPVTPFARGLEETVRWYAA